MPTYKFAYNLKEFTNLTIISASPDTAQSLLYLTGTDDKPVT